MAEVESPYLKASQEAAKEYDSRLFWLAGGAITLTFALANSMASSRVLVSFAWLAWGIGLFVLGLVMAMVSHQFTIRACHDWFEYVNLGAQQRTEETAKGMDKRKSRATRLTVWITVLNYAALAAIVCGIACVSVFAIHNLSKGVRSDAPGTRAKTAAHAPATTAAHATTTAAATYPAARGAAGSEGLATATTSITRSSPGRT